MWKKVKYAGALGVFGAIGTAMTIDSWSTEKSKPKLSESEMLEAMERLERTRITNEARDGFTESQHVAESYAKMKKIIEKMKIENTNPSIKADLKHLEDTIDISEQSTRKALSVFDFIKEWGSIRDNFISVGPGDWNFFDKYKEFLSTLNSEQLGCLSNALCFMVIIYCSHSIFSSYYGNILIAYLNLETKYPRFAKYLKFRTKLTNWSIHVYFAIIYIVLFF